MKSFVYFFIVGVLIGEACCGDVMCFLEKIKDPSSYMEIFTPSDGVEALCQKLPTLFKKIRNDVKACDLNVTVDGLESLLTEACDPGSTLIQDLLESKNCLVEKASTLTCMPILGKQSIETIREKCKKRGDMEKCLIDGVGKPCGEKVLNVMKNFTVSLESFYEGWCAEAGNGAAANSAFWWMMLFGVLFSLMKFQSF